MRRRRRGWASFARRRRRSEDDGIIYAVVGVLRVVARRVRVRGCVASNTPRTARARGVVNDGTLLT